MNTRRLFIKALVAFLLFSQTSFPQTFILVDENTPIRVLIPDTTVSATWRSSPTFKDSSWMEGHGGVGFGQVYEPFIQLPVGDRMSNRSRSCMIRIKFDVTSEQISKIKRLMLHIRYDDGYALYLNGGLIASENAPSNPKFNSLATGEHNAGQEPDIFHPTFNFRFNVYLSAASLLREGTNLLAIQGFNVSPDDPDFLLTYKLVLETFGTPPVLESSNLPIMVINTNNVEIPEDERIVADMGLIDNGPGQRNSISDPFNNYNGKVSIEVHGASSSSFPKRSYNIETQDGSGQNNNVSLLGMPEENDWILLSFYTDKTLMRDVLMYKLSNLMGRYASRARYCELILNGQYTGVYALLERIKRDKNRVDISQLDADDIQGDSLTGGYIFKLDQPDPEKVFYVSEYRPYPGAAQRIEYMHHYPEVDDIKAEQTEYLRNFIRAFETAMDGADYADPVNGYTKYIDEDSFVDYFLLSEICKNVDGYRLSAFFYKDRDDKGGKLNAGPIWDMNFSLGNAGYYGSDSTQGWQLDGLSFGNDIRTDFQLPPFWWEKLVREPRFSNKIIERWRSLRNTIFSRSSVEALIDAYADTLQEAQARNFQIFSGPGDAGRGFWVTPFIFYTFNTYEDEINYLKFWINERMTWMDEQITSLTSINEETDSGLPGQYALLQNYPNPFNPITNFRFRIPNFGFVTLKVFDLLGRVVAIIVNEYLPAGEYSYTWDASNYSSGVYFYKLQAGGFTETRKMTLMK